MRTLGAIAILLSLNFSCSSKTTADAVGAIDTTDTVKNSTPVKIFGSTLYFTTVKPFTSDCANQLGYTESLLSAQNACTQITVSPLNSETKQITVSGTGTDLTLTVNTDKTISIGGRKYFCYQDSNTLTDSGATSFSEAPRVFLTTKAAKGPSDLGKAGVAYAFLGDDCEILQ